MRSHACKKLMIKIILFSSSFSSRSFEIAQNWRKGNANECTKRRIRFSYPKKLTNCKFQLPVSCVSKIPLLIRKKNSCRDPGSNQGPLDLQSNALPTELSRLLKMRSSKTAGSGCYPPVFVENSCQNPNGRILNSFKNLT